MVENIRAFHNLTASEKLEMGKKACAYYEREFSKENLMQQLEKELKQVCDENIND
ncbi:TPA: hypothetical protein VB850_000834 [Streptococcus suis]|nr:hypothetical protein [Streptococcus suis]NQN72844.1 hypothetical protein [Streptococcus suis]HEL2684710.1 hypothetical protein [Streptococcus suis]HEP1832510.1 hypothetical protein [Streptococcus suis]